MLHRSPELLEPHCDTTMLSSVASQVLHFVLTLALSLL